MSEKIDTGKEAMDPFDTKRKELHREIEEHQASILRLNERIDLMYSLQCIIRIFSGAKVVRWKRYTDDSTIEVILPDIETLGAFFRELEHLNSKMPKVALTYSGKIAGDEVLAEVKIQFKG